MFNNQLNERKTFKYPPFHRLIKITLKHKEDKILNEAANYLSELLRKSFGKRILGPEFPIVSRVKSLFLKDILLKIQSKN